MVKVIKIGSDKTKLELMQKTYFAINNKDIGQYFAADTWEDAESFCACNGLILIGEIDCIIEIPKMN